MKHDPMCWQLSLATGDDDTARNRNKRLTGMPVVRTIKWKSNGSGVVHSPETPGAARRRYEKYRLETCVKVLAPVGVSFLIVGNVCPVNHQR